MNLTNLEMVAVTATLAAILMVGSRHLRLNLLLYSLQTLAIAGSTVLRGQEEGSSELVWVALAITVLKAIATPIFLSWIIRRVSVQNDTGTMLPAPVAMHLSIALFAVSYVLTRQLPAAPGGGTGVGAACGLSLLFTGLLLMLTRRVALSQIVGFLTMENGIYLFALTQTVGMPMMVESGIFLDVLVGVMIAGLLLFRIKSSFEHLDVTQLSELKE